MHTLLCQLIGSTIEHLRGDRRLHLVARQGGVSSDTWRKWEQGLQLPAKPQLPRILTGLDCSEDRLELTFLLTARLRLERRKSQCLDRAAAKFPEFGELVAAFETSMLLQQSTMEQLELLAGGLDLLEAPLNSKALHSQTSKDKANDKK